MNTWRDLTAKPLKHYTITYNWDVLTDANAAHIHRICRYTGNSTDKYYLMTGLSTYAQINKYEFDLNPPTDADVITIRVPNLDETTISMTDIPVTAGKEVMYGTWKVRITPVIKVYLKGLKVRIEYSYGLDSWPISENKLITQYITQNGYVVDPETVKTVFLFKSSDFLDFTISLK